MLRMHRDRIKKQGRRRLLFQLAAAALFNGYFIGFAKGKIFQGKSKAICVPVLNCYSCPGALGACPVGSLQSTLGQGKFPFYILGMLMLFGLLLGRTVCGLLCPFGLVQDLLSRIPVKKLTVPKKADKVLRWLKYAVLLVLVLALPALVRPYGVGAPWFCKYLCPAGTLEGGIPLLLANSTLRQAMGAIFSWKAAVLIVILVLSVLIPRPFCRYLCPLGAFYGLFSRFSLVHMQLNEKACTHCRSCHAVCPMALEPDAGGLDSAECIRCGACAAACPADSIARICR